MHANRSSQSSGIPSRGRHNSGKINGISSPAHVSQEYMESPVDVHIYDDDGVNVTPKSLSHLNSAFPARMPPRGSADPSHTFTIDQISGSAQFSRSGRASDNHASTQVCSSDRQIEDTCKKSEPFDAPSPSDEVTRSLEFSQSDPPEEKREREVGFTLTESDTFWLLGISGRCVAIDDPECDAIKVANARYRTLLEKRSGSELYIEGGVQTVNPVVKAKEIQSVCEIRTTISSQATIWEIHDASHAERISKDETEGSSSGMLSRKRNSAVKYPASEDETRVTPSPVVGLVNLKSAAAQAEKALLQNTHHENMLLYRNYQAKHAVFLGSEEHSTRSLIHLWDFKSETTNGRHVSCIAWNAHAPDLLAVGYGNLDFDGRQDGMVAFWSLKNPEHPEWTFPTSFGVTALDFSCTDFNLLAVGLFDGTVSVYDVRTPTHKALAESGHGVPGKHCDPVWKLKWVKQGPDRDEMLVSISTDGRVTQWNLKKGFDFIDLMKLSRVSRKSSGEARTLGSSAPKAEALISRRGGGTCFDFSSEDGSVYVVGTEDGMLHKCSSVYNEQYLENYFGHNGAVQQVSWSPFAKNVFISASSDWTIKLWREDSEVPVLSMQSGSEHVSDVCWSPKNSTVFATTSWNGQLDVWDLSISTLKPVLSTSASDSKLSCVLFSQNSPVVVAGGCDGRVGVYRLVGLNDRGADSRERLYAAMSNTY